MKQINPQIQPLLDRLVAEGTERGLQVAAYRRGELVLDAWAGVADRATGRKVDGETFFPAFSTAKGVMATMIHQLVERGRLDYETPIAALWPGFAAQGKETITVRHALNHTSGLPYMPPGVGNAEICDWDGMCARLAALKPASAPGVTMTYHPITFSWLLGETARRADGRPFAQLLEEEICRPLGLDSLFFGIPDRVEPQVATIEEIADGSECKPAAHPDDPQGIPSTILPLGPWMNRADARRACVPGSNGIMNARAIARHYAALLPGGLNGVELLPPRRVAEATVRQFPTGSYGEKERFMSLGYHLGEPGSTMGARETTFGHTGYGGSLGFADPEAGLAVGFMKNRFSKEGGTALLMEAVRAALAL